MRRALAPLCALALLGGLARSASADGEVQLRNAYYKEQATRVVQPMLDVKLDVAQNVELKAHTLLDAISSASVVAFDENRYEGGAGVTASIGDYKVGGFTRYSHEMDYQSLFGAVQLSAELAQKNTTLSLVVGGGNDSVDNAGAQGVMGTIERGGTMRMLLVSTGVAQLLSPNTLVAVTYDLTSMRGFLENPYRLVPVAGVVNNLEEVPDSRLRHALFAHARHFLPGSKTTLVASYRLYFDDWDVVAHTPSVRVVQELAPRFNIEVSYRYHRQGSAYFFLPVYDDPDQMWYTTDVKLSAFDSHAVGVGGNIELSNFGITGLLGGVRLDILMQYVDQNNRFGNAVVLQTGMAIPFGT